ncbi:major facilitator superfamily domain-containing protein [Cladochytrium replicatum]|nr:major facilitator superfamily domain-containing protein [Cladochytrium replicatum]
MSILLRPFQGFSAEEGRNIGLYIGGIMAYKFGLETMNACMSGIFLNRLAGVVVSTGTLWTGAQSVNLVCQCIGSLLVGPLIKRMTAARLLTTAIILFGVVICIMPILEGATGGSVPGYYENLKGSQNKATWGSWTPYLIYMIYPLAGIFHGMVELMRRVIPAEIVGGDAVKLRRMDALVHVCYEITGTVGALMSPYWISYFGWGYAVTIMPIAFAISATLWYFLRPSETKVKALEKFKAENKGRGIFKDMGSVFYSYFYSIWVGVKLVCTQRALIWLIPAYALALVHHRYLENTLFPFYAKSELKNSDFQNILTGGSNFGELLGALTVLALARHVKTPIPFLRLDAILVLVVWIFPYVTVPTENVLGFVWSLTPVAAIISFGWASGDVSLAAYVQSRLAGIDSHDAHTSPLAAVMSFLYVTYLVVYFILANVMATVRDNWKAPSKELYIWIGGVMMTIAGAIVFASTFIPRGSFAFNPDPDTIKFNGDEYGSTPVSSDEEVVVDRKKSDGADVVELMVA